MPVFLSPRNPNNIAFPYLHNGFSPLLNPAGARAHEQGLAKWMRMPCGSSAWLEGDACPDGAPGIIEKRFNLYRAGEVFCRRLTGLLGACTRDLDRVQVRG